MEQKQLEYLIERVEAMDKKYDEKLDKILIQTTKTNGTVKSHDAEIISIKKDVDLLKESKNMIKGRDKAIWVFIGALGSVFLVVLGHFLLKK